MSKQPPTDAQMPPEQPDRRAFLKGLTALGGVAGGILGLAGAAQAQPPPRPGGPPPNAQPRSGRGIRGPRRPDGPSVRPGMGGPGDQPPTLNRAAGTLSFKSDELKVIKAGKSAGQQIKQAPASELSGRKPSSRTRLFGALGDTRSGQALLVGLGIALPDDDDPRSVTYAPSRDLSAMIQNSLIARAYYEGVVLTTTGCVYAPGITAPSEDPVTYVSWGAYVDPPSVKDQRCRVYGSPSETSILAFWLTGPGSSNTSLTYLLELSLSGVAPDEFHGKVNGTEFEFIETSDGTLVAMPELPGTDNLPPNQIQIIQDGQIGAVVDFEWLNILAF